MHLDQQVKQVMDRLLPGLWGVCAFSDALPLIPCRAASRIPEQARSVLVCLFPCYTGEHRPRNLARYAVPDDYHSIAGGILEQMVSELSVLFPGAHFAAFVDSSPIREVRAAALAGLGAVGRHGLLIHPQYGSELFIGSVVTTLELPALSQEPRACCGCGRCADWCPSGALRPDGSFLRERCRSHITQKKGTLTEWETDQIRRGGLVWGCDCCLDACPENRKARTPIPAFYDNPVACYTPALTGPALARKAYAWRGEGVLLRNHQIITDQE